MKPFTITCYPYGSDAKLFIKIINIGIDSHLEGFTESKFYVPEPRMQGSRLTLDFAISELPILIRRLREEGSEEAERWADNIEEASNVQG